MIYKITMQIGYYEDNDTYHGPFLEYGQVEAQSIEEAIAKAHIELKKEERKYQEPEDMMSSAIMTIRDANEQLVFDHALGILAEEAGRAETDDEAKANVLARIRKDPAIGRRARAALRAASIESIKAILGPVASIIIAAIEAWNDPDDSM